LCDHIEPAYAGYAGYAGRSLPLTAHLTASSAILGPAMNGREGTGSDGVGDPGDGRDRRN
jgi:hypothetical protein